MPTPWASVVAGLTPTHWYKVDEAAGVAALADSGSVVANLGIQQVVSQAGSTTPAGFSVDGLVAGDPDKAGLWDGVRGALALNVSPVTNNYSLAVSFKNTVTNQIAGIAIGNGVLIAQSNVTGDGAGNLVTVTLLQTKVLVASGAIGVNGRHLIVVTRAANNWRVTVDGVALTLSDNTAPQSSGHLGLAGDFQFNRWPFTGITDEYLVFQGGPLTVAQESLLYQTWVTDRATSGQVEWKHSAGVGVSGANLTALTDGDISTGFAVDTTKTYVGLDFGVAVPITMVALANPQGSQIANQAGRVNTAISIYGSAADPNLGGAKTALADITETIVDGELNEFPVTGSHRFLTLPLVNYDSNKQYLNELQAYGPVGSGVPVGAGYKPLPPVLSPSGGVFPSARVSMVCPTPSALIYYTVDGSTPDNTKTLYVNTVTVTTTTTLKAVAYDVTSGTYSRVTSRLFTIRSKRFDVTQYQLDEQGNRSQFHAGDVTWDAASQKYYGNGMWMRAIQHTGSLDPRYIAGIYSYSSQDLVNWRREGWAYRTPVHNSSPTSSIVRIQRFHSLRCPLTSRYVGWATGPYTLGDPIPIDNYGTLVFESNGPAGPFNVVHNDGVGTNLGNISSGYYVEDESLFQDEDGTGYLIAHVGDVNGVDGLGGQPNANAGMMIFRLAPDYKSADLSAKVHLIGFSTTTREAPLKIKRDGVYFAINCSAEYYNSSVTNDVRYLVNEGPDPITGAWYSPEGGNNGTLAYSGDPVSDAAPYVNNTQPTRIVPLVGWVDSEGFQANVYIGDYWTQSYQGGFPFWIDNPSPYTGIVDSKTVFAPVIFPTRTTMRIIKPGVDTASVTWDPSDFFVAKPSQGLSLPLTMGNIKRLGKRFG